MRLDQQSGGYENAYKYTGKELDAETDLYYYGARYYDAKIGRFVSVDPWSGDLSDPQSFNKYSYVRNNPLKYTDPSGENIRDFLSNLIAPKAYAPALEDNVGNINELMTTNQQKVTEGAQQLKVIGKGTFEVATGVTEIWGGIVTASSSVGGNAVGPVIGAGMISDGVANSAVGILNVLGGALGETDAISSPFSVVPYPSVDIMQEASKEFKDKNVLNQNDQLKTQNHTNFQDYYTIQSGDTLSGVFGNKWQEIASYNNLTNPDCVYAGQKIKVPKNNQSKAE